MGRIFGTDGVRGIANTELSCELAMNIGRAAAIVLTKHSHTKPVVLIGKDTRVSCGMLEGALIAGLCSVGADVISIGETPTPAVAYLVKHFKADAGVMISASHNPCEYNGIKLFNHQGFKLPDALEDEIEDIVLNPNYEYPMPAGRDLGCCKYDRDAIDAYINHLVSSVDVRFDGLKLALDCANGSAYKTAERLFSMLGAKCYMLSDQPDGININESCGSTHLGNLIDFVRNNNIDLGLAFDGDADRCLAVDENGEIIDGDKIIAICSLDMKRRGILKDNTAVVTVMSNMGFNVFAKDNDINVTVTAVGDRYVLEKMIEKDYNLGGEQSGHLIFKDFATTGDGQLSGLQLAANMIRNKMKASELSEIMDVYPQTCVNIKATNEGKLSLKNDDIIIDKIYSVSTMLGESGRVLVRASGTEPLIRVMLEGKDLKEIENFAQEIAQVIIERIS